MVKNWIRKKQWLEHTIKTSTHEILKISITIIKAKLFMDFMIILRKSVDKLLSTSYYSFHISYSRKTNQGLTQETKHCRCVIKNWKWLKRKDNPYTDQTTYSILLLSFTLSPFSHLYAILQSYWPSFLFCSRLYNVLLPHLSLKVSSSSLLFIWLLPFYVPSHLFRTFSEPFCLK